MLESGRGRIGAPSAGIACRSANHDVVACSWWKNLPRVRKEHQKGEGVAHPHTWRSTVSTVPISPAVRQDTRF